MLLERDVVIDGKRLEVVMYQTPEAVDPPIIMLHEGLGSVALWKSFPSDVAKRTGRRVIAYSRYGHGQSAVLDSARDVEYMHHEAQVVLPRVMDRLHIDRAVLLGHSDGASIALIAAGTDPERVCALVLEAPHVFVEDRTLAGIAAARTAYLQTELSQRLARYHRDGGRTFWGWNNIWLDPRFRTWNIESYLPAVACPALLIQGDGDEYGSVAQLHAISARVARTQTVLLANCGHSPHRDQPSATVDAIERFLQTDVLPAS